MTEEEQKEYNNAKEDYEEIANSMSKQDLIDFYVEKMLEGDYVITEREHKNCVELNEYNSDTGEFWSVNQGKWISTD